MGNVLLNQLFRALSITENCIRYYLWRIVDIHLPVTLEAASFITYWLPYSIETKSSSNLSFQLDISVDESLSKQYYIDGDNHLGVRVNSLIKPF